MPKVTQEEAYLTHQVTRRRFLGGAVVATGAALGPACASRPGSRPSGPPPLSLFEFEPRSMLRTPEHKVARARFPVIDFHTHLGFNERFDHGVPVGAKVSYFAPPEELLPVLDEKNVATMVNLTGGVGAGLRETIARYDRAHPGRFLSFTEPDFAGATASGYAQRQADLITQAKRDGARGLKILKTLGLYLRENLTRGALVAIDDPRFDPMWETCGSLGLPVAIHVSDPDAFFTPIDRHNERYEELAHHPDWSFHGGDFPPKAALLEARNRVIARHPKTKFVGLHVGNRPEDLSYVSECLERHPNLSVEIAARIGELGRQPRAARRFFERYQDRILFGTDAVPHGDEYPQQLYGRALYEIYFRFLETEDEYFDYAPAAVPPQGRWKIYGLGLPEEILRKIYRDNAARLLGLAG